MRLKEFVAVLVCVMAAGTAFADAEAGHSRPKSVIAVCGTSSADVAWEPMTDVNLTSYDIYYRSQGQPEFVKANQAIVTATEYTVEGLATGLSYEFEVTALFTDGHSSDPSDPASCITG